MGINKVLGWLERLVTKFPAEPTKKNYGASGDDNPGRMTPGAWRKRQMFRRDPILLFLGNTPLDLPHFLPKAGVCRLETPASEGQTPHSAWLQNS
jgi:hypothetical protein